MREILFRGKRTYNGKWTYGFPCYIYDKCETILCMTEYGDQEKSATFSHTYGIVPKTLGQYTGLTDKNGTKIFEGDIVKCYCGAIVQGVREHTEDIIVNLEDWEKLGLLNECEENEVIGNIYDNPELMKG